MLSVVDLALGYGDVTIVERVSFDVRRGETIALVGPSGVGKSTILAALAGLAKPIAGSIVTERGELLGPTPEHAIVFQDGALFPWLTLAQNVAYALARRSVSRVSRAGRVKELLARVKLEGHGEKFPHELSGGMKKRGAFARALATDPALLLLDEPFSALDVTTRAELHRELQSLFTERGVAVVIVTHDLAEAAIVADRTLVVDFGAFTRAATIVDVIERDPVIEKTIARLSRALAGKTEETSGALQTHVAHRHRSFDLDARVVGAR